MTVPCLPCLYCHYPRADDDGYICLLTNTEACAPCRNVANLDDKIQKMRAAVLQMEKQRLEWKTKVNVNHDGLTHRMPLEITSAIFEFCLPEDVTTADIRFERSIHTLGAPLVLSAVSQRWRDIAHTTPRLWSDIPIRVGEKNMFSLLVLAKEWIGRSGKRPLSINFYTEKNYKPAQELIKVLNKYASRWTSLKVGGESAALNNFSTNIEGVSKLQALCLSTGVAHSRRAGKLDLGKFILQPKRLVIEHFQDFDEINIKWNHLVELVIERGVRVDDCLEVLRRAPHLTKCTLSPEFNIGFTPPGSIQCNNIMDLTLVANHSLAASFLDLLLCPSLNTLTIIGYHQSVPTDRVVNFMQKSMCTISTLSIQKMTLENQDLDLLLPAIPTIRHLEIELRLLPELRIGQQSLQLKVNGHFFSLLAMVSNAGSETRPLYLPELRSLTIHQRKSEYKNWATSPSVLKFDLPFDAIRNSMQHRKELKSEFKFNMVNAKSEAEVVEHIDVHAWKELRTLENHGVSIKIQFGQDTKDMVWIVL